MAIPVISTTTSVLDYEVNRRWAFQPYATEEPTEWSLHSGDLPEGMTFDSDTGKISGAATEVGVFVFALIATNGDGDSEPQVFPVAISPKSETLDSTAIIVDINVVTRKAVVYPDALKERNDTRSAAAEHAIKYGDDLIYYVRFWKYGVRVAPPIRNIAYAVKIDQDAPPVFRSDDWYELGTSNSKTFAVSGTVKGAALRGELLDADAVIESHSDRKIIAATVEFEWLEENLDELYGRPMFRSSSLAMPILIALDYQEIQQ